MPPELIDTSMSTDIILKGSLRKAKSWNKRFFVLRDGSPARLEYYDNERRWKANKPKRRINLEKPWNVDTKRDSKHEFLIVIFTEDEYFSMAAENAEIQAQWVNALQRVVRPDPGSMLFKHVWHVVLDNKELEVSKSSLLINLNGPHRVCLTHDQMVFVHANHHGGSDLCRGDPIEIRITSIRVCGHKESMFFIEPGRASGIGIGKLWMSLSDEAMAAQMHSTILNLMYALKQEEDLSYRGRSYSSGSNSGRMRSVRSQNNHPPPSQIGMGKVSGILSSSSSKRNRCASLPGSHILDLNDPRLRTGSEGETTMSRPSRFCSLRNTNGSTSPSMRYRLWNHHVKRGTSTYCHHCHNNPTHPHTVSLPGSCNNSSAASSTECLNSGLAPSNEFCTCYSSGAMSHLAPLTQSPVKGEHQPSEESINRHSPTLGYMQLDHQNSSSCSTLGYQQCQCSGKNTTSDYLTHTTTTPPIHENSVELNSSSPCFTHLPSSHHCYESHCHQQAQVSFEKAPPPPSIQPPSNPPGNMTTPIATCRECPKTSTSHYRTQSLDDNTSYGTASSSLSVSPQQPVNTQQSVESSEYVPMSEQIGRIQFAFPSDGYSTPNTPISSSPKERGAAFPTSTEDYEIMGNSAKYPHQSMSMSNHKPSSHNFIYSKLVSLATGGLSSSSLTQDRASPPSPDDTPMTTLENCCPSMTKNQEGKGNGYVPMRSFTNKSLPKSVESRRFSVPDTVLRNGNIPINPNSTSPYGHSPDKDYELMNPMHHFYSNCVDRQTACRRVDGESEYSNMKPVIPHYNYHLKLSCENVQSHHRFSIKSSDEYLSMRPIQQELSDIEFNRMDRSRTSTGDSKHSNNSSSPSESEYSEGYLPMSPLNISGMNGASLREHTKPKAIVQRPQYPHQKKVSVDSTDSAACSLEKTPLSPKKSRKRSKSLRFRYSLTSSSRRSQSMKQVKRRTPPSLDIFREAQIQNTTSNEQSRPPLSPGGDYVRIDYTKAKAQAALSPYVIKTDDVKDLTDSPRLRHVENCTNHGIEANI